jgi:kynureninase
LSGLTLAHCEALDAADPLAHFRDQFQLRDGLIYLDGNSLGVMPKATAGRMASAISSEWAEGLITSWLGADWVNSPRRIGDKIGGFLGAEPGEVIAADSTSVNIFKALTAAISLNPGRRIILTEATNFPTDHYIMQGVASIAADIEARAVAPEALVDAIDENVAVVLLTQVHYKSGLIRNMAEITAKAHEKGALIVWDLSHSAGAIPVDLNGANADFAIGCGYKFLNGGPGAPAFLFAARRHHAEAKPVLSGWFGHAAPFAFEEGYRAAPGIERFLCGTPPVLALIALECGVDIMADADMGELRRKSEALGELFIQLMDERCGDLGFTLISPRDTALRGSQVSYSHAQGYAIVQALKERDVIGDFRAPDVLRFGLTPLYVRYADVFNAVDAIHEIVTTGAWDRPEYRERAAVT